MEKLRDYTIQTDAIQVLPACGKFDSPMISGKELPKSEVYMYC